MIELAEIYSELFAINKEVQENMQSKTSIDANDRSLADWRNRVKKWI